MGSWVVCEAGVGKHLANWLKNQVYRSRDQIYGGAPIILLQQV